MDSITIQARAKLNLTLNVLGKRSDGYHLLQSVMQTIALHDVITIQKAGEYPALQIECTHDEVPVDQRNLAHKAAMYFIQNFRLPTGVRVHIQKNIPVSAGLAGGSADCAATLTGINDLFKLGVSQPELIKAGTRLGADIPFCLLGGTALAEGIGEKLTPLPAHPSVHIVLVKPPVAISTKEIFEEYDNDIAAGPPQAAVLINALEHGDARRAADCFCNDLLPVTAHKCPVIYQLITAMRRMGALNASMTGSGPSVFGYFETEASAHHCIAEIKQNYSSIQDIFLTSVSGRRNSTMME